MSLLLGHGHPHAQHYPLGMVAVEAEFVVERLNRAEATRATLLQMAVSTVLGGKKAINAFNKQVRQLSGD